MDKSKNIGITVLDKKKCFFLLEKIETGWIFRTISMKRKIVVCFAVSVREFRRGAGCPFQRARPAGEVSADTGVKPRSSLGEPAPNRSWA